MRQMRHYLDFVLRLRNSKISFLAKDPKTIAIKEKISVPTYGFLISRSNFSEGKNCEKVAINIIPQNTLKERYSKSENSLALEAPLKDLTRKNPGMVNKRRFTTSKGICSIIFEYY